SSRDFWLRDAELPLQLVGERLRIRARRQLADADEVRDRLAFLARQDLRRIAGVSQLVVQAERRALVRGGSEQHRETAAGAHRALAFLDLGLERPLPQLLGVDEADGLRFGVDTAIELQRLVHGLGGLAFGANLDLAFDQADHLVVLAAATPQVRAADPGGDLRDADVDLALALLADELGREAERALQHAERGAENLLRAVDLREAQRAVLAELHHAALGEAHQRARAGAGED